MRAMKYEPRQSKAEIIYAQRVAKKDYKCKCCGTNGFVYVEELDVFLCLPRYEELLTKRKLFLSGAARPLRRPQT